MVFFYCFIVNNLLSNPLFLLPKKEIKMKRILLFTLAFSAGTTFAQSLKLETGKKITSNTINSVNMDMGMAGQMKIDGSTISMIEVTGSDTKNYSAKTSIVKMKMSQEGMGQNVNFDSDKKEDRESDMGKELGKMLDVAASVTIDKNTGKVSEQNKKEVITDNSNPMASLMGNSNSAEAATAAAFFYIPNGKKIGDKWSDSLSEAGMKGLKTFELKSIVDNIATIAITTKSKGTISKEAQGMQFDITMDGTGNGEIIVDTKTFLVRKNTLSNDVNGTLDMMGQSMPLTIKSVATTVFE